MPVFFFPDKICDSVIALVSTRPSSFSDDFIPQCYSDGLKRPKRMTCKIVSFCQGSNNVNNNRYQGTEKDNTLLKGFSDFLRTFTPFNFCT